MQIVVCGSSGAGAYPQFPGQDIEFTAVKDVEEARCYPAEAYFFLDEGMAGLDFGFTKKPVFLNAVTTCKSDFKCNPENIYRFNAWPGFWENDTWEIAGSENDQLASLAAAIGKRFCFVPDIPGLVSPRIIVSIINEAYLAFEEGVGSREDIDTAMKQGTNYPFGPFEWAGKIGLSAIVKLLEVLAKEQEALPVSSLLVEESKTKSHKQ